MATFKKNISQVRIIYVLTTLFLVGLSFFSFVQIKKLAKSGEMMNHTTLVSLELEKLLSCIKDAETGHRGYLLTHDGSFLEHFYSGLLQYPPLIKSVEQLTIDNRVQQKNLIEVKRLCAAKEAQMRMILLAEKQGKLIINELGKGKIVMDSLRVLISKMEKLETNLQATRSQSFNTFSNITPLYIIVLFLGSLLILSVSYFSLTKAIDYSNKLQKTLKEIVMESDVAVCMLKGPQHYIELANNHFLALHGNRDICYLTIRQALPNDEYQPLFHLLDNVYQTGQRAEQTEMPAMVTKANGDTEQRIFHFLYKPTHNEKGKMDGITITATDITQLLIDTKNIKENQEQLRLALEGGEFGTFDFYPQKNELYWSAKTKEIFGFPAGNEPVNYQTYLKILHPEDNQNFEKVLASISQPQSKGLYEIEYRIYDKTTRKIKWIRSKGKGSFDAEKKPLRFTGVVQDITERKLNEQTLQASERRFKTLADSMPQHIWTADAYGNLNYYNQSVFDYSGLTIEQINKEGWLQIVHPEDRAENMKAWIHAVTTGADFIFEHRFRRHDGAYQWQLSRAVPIKDNDGNITMWVGSSTNIQHQKDVASQLQTQVDQRTIELVEKNKLLVKTNKELELYAHISSHDLQSPLGKIQMSISRIAENDLDKLSDKGKEHFKRVQQATIDMQKLMEDLQTYNRSNSKGGTFETTNLNTIMAEIIYGLKERIEEKNAVIEIDQLCIAVVIPFEFKQMMHNLIGNALKFSKPGVPPHIVIRSRVDAGENLTMKDLLPKTQYCHLMIKDNGIGFEPKYSEKIFEVFQRLHGKEVYKGTGIGLAIVKKIIENHQGIIIAKGEIGVGAIFDIYLPTNQTN